MSAGKKKLIICTIFPALASVVLISAALATHFWVTSSPEKKTSNNGTIGFENSVNFGLFKGHKTINFGIGTRDSDIEVVCVAADAVCAWLSEGDVYLYKTGDVLIKTLLEVHKNTTGELYEVGLFSYGQWITTIMMAALGIAFGLISVGFAIFNAVGKPIETITGPMGLYLWNGLACFFTILAMVLYLVLFFTTYKKNFLNYDEWKQLRVEGTTNLGYSFFFVVIAMVLYLINIIILFLSGYKLRCSFGSEAEKVVDNGIILF
ncbi:hypothetical protein CHS0354_006098 [Potamilus streckersoni]|uniref:Clarin-3 n=1 Tax=Potamilus streckersoni TaxID=2493646 RepID=A0AAE0SUE7_9BIVA|nr:hypothetical protein CHS0354_006098 [Potamilus streckersoni]